MEFQSFNMIFFIVLGFIANYYITFEFEGGERKELKVKGTDFGMIVSGDRGEVHYKGTQFLEFVRVVEA
nr:DUF2500 family protein [Paenibacillus polymyxa]